jgi:hypothetical protein
MFRVYQKERKKETNQEYALGRGLRKPHFRHGARGGYQFESEGKELARLPGRVALSCPCVG